MLAIKQKKIYIETELEPLKDEITTEYEIETDYDENGNEIKKRIPKRINLTKRMQGEEQLVKQMTAEEKIEQIEKYFEIKEN